MSIICSSDKGWVISHYDYSKNLYKNVLSQSGRVDLAYKENLFNIITPLMKDQEAQKMFEMFVDSSCSHTVSKLRKRPLISAEVESEIQKIQDVFLNLIQVTQKLGYFNYKLSPGDLLSNNAVARKFVDKFYDEEKDSASNGTHFEGGNSSVDSKISMINKKEYVIPQNCFFLLSDVKSFYGKMNNEKFDFILLDPPWKNKHVRRKLKQCQEKGYQMIDNESISEIPVEKLLCSSGLVGVWCTNAPKHVKDIKELFFLKWGLEYVSTWFWLKITTSGEPICSFYNTNGKKPYERIVFGARKNRSHKVPEEDKCIISVPSALHSHKPPLTDVLHEYLPEDAKCLELFARYLLPGWTSIGNQVLMLQSMALFEVLSSDLRE